jgi:shikimate dehydrogenase
MIRGTTELVAHIGYPTHTFKSPMIYNPYFEQAGIDAVVVPMSCEAERYQAFLKSVFALTNVRGAIITMPHKVSTVGLLDELTTAVKIAGSCNVVRRRGCRLEGLRAFVVGCGGVGSAIAASLAAAGRERALRQGLSWARWC